MLNLKERSALENYDLLKKVPEFAHIKEVWRQDVTKSGKFFTSKLFSNAWDRKHRLSKKYLSFFHDHNDSVGLAKRTRLDTLESTKQSIEQATKVICVNTLRDDSLGRQHERKMERINVQMESSQQIYNLMPPDIADLHVQHDSQKDSRVLIRSLNHGHTLTGRANSTWNELNQSSPKHLNLSINQSIIEKDEEGFAQIANRIEKDAQFDALRLNLIQDNMTKIRNTFRQKSLSNYEFEEKAIRSRTSPQKVTSIVPDLHRIRNAIPIDPKTEERRRIQTEYSEYLQQEKEEKAIHDHLWRQDKAKYMLNTSVSQLSSKRNSHQHQSRPRTYSDSNSHYTNNNNNNCKHSGYEQFDPTPTGTLEGYSEQSTNAINTPQQQQQQQNRQSYVKSALKTRKASQSLNQNNSSIDKEATQQPSLMSMYDPSFEVERDNEKRTTSFSTNKKVVFDASHSVDHQKHQDSFDPYSNNYQDSFEGRGYVKGGPFVYTSPSGSATTTIQVDSALDEGSTNSESRGYSSPALRLKYLKSPQDHKLSQRMIFLSQPKSTAVASSHQSREEFRGLLCTEAERIDPKTTNAFVATMTSKSSVFRDTLKFNEASMTMKHSMRKTGNLSAVGGESRLNSLGGSFLQSSKHESLKSTIDRDASIGKREIIKIQSNRLAPLPAVMTVQQQQEYQEHFNEMETFEKNKKKSDIKRRFPNKKLDEFHSFQQELEEVKRKDSGAVVKEIIVASYNSKQQPAESQLQIIEESQIYSQDQ